MPLFPHKNWHQSEAQTVTHMQILAKTKIDRSTMSSCGQRGRGQTAGGSCICWMALLLLLMLVPGKWIPTISHNWL